MHDENVNLIKAIDCMRSLLSYVMIDDMMSRHFLVFVRPAFLSRDSDELVSAFPPQKMARRNFNVTKDRGGRTASRITLLMDNMLRR